jgi:Pyridoxal-dependent decarboxylase, C-terminal sheet domain
MQWDVINLGGGFRPLPTDTWRDFAQDLNRLLSPWYLRRVRTWAEPGTYLFMDTTVVAALVYSVQHEEGHQRCWLAESLYGSLVQLKWDEFAEKATSSMRIYQQQPDSTTISTTMYGNTCDWDDVVLPKAQLPRMQSGDRVVWGNMGAYARACATDFNGLPYASKPPEYMYSDGFHVATAVQDVPGKGQGIVLLQPVKEGSVIYAFGPLGVTHICHTESSVLEHIAPMSETDAQFFLNHIFCWQGTMIELIGSCKFMNHCGNPTLKLAPGSDSSWVATRDLEVGEEITDNYATFDNPPWYVEICRARGVEWTGYVADQYS